MMGEDDHFLEVGDGFHVIDLDFTYSNINRMHKSYKSRNHLN